MNACDRPLISDRGRSLPAGYRWSASVVAALLLTLALALPALAQGPVVDTLADDESDGCAANNCTLREAITDATAGDTITFDASIAGGTITLGSELSID